MFLKFFSALFGYNYELVKAQTTVSKQKIVTMGTLVLIPVTLWFISGFYLSKDLYEAPTWQALFIGALMSSAILIIDRAFIVLSKENGGNECEHVLVPLDVNANREFSLCLDPEPLDFLKIIHNVGDGVMNVAQYN
jgi:hypothetical protein